MQCAGQSTSGACQRAAARKDIGFAVHGLRVRLASGAAPSPCAPSQRSPVATSSVGRRGTANWTPGSNEPISGVLRPASAFRPGSSPVPGQNGLTTIMGEGGKSSSLRKLVVDGVDDSAEVQVKFCLKYRTSYGQSVKIIGSHPKLGSWDINKALVLSWTEGDRWVANVELPAGAVYEYKYVLVDHDGRSALAWQGGSNSVLAIGDSDERDGVEVQDNWNNNPGQAAVLAGGLSTTREDKLQAWAAEMRQYRTLARAAQFELSRKAEELQASKAQIARLKMELSVSLKAREDLESRLAEVEGENLSLRAQVAQSQIAMKSTLEEAIKLLQQEIEEGEEDLYGVEDEEMPASVSGGVVGPSSSSSASAPSSSGSSSAGGKWGWGLGAASSKEPEAVYAGSNGNGNGSSSSSGGGGFERFGFRLSANSFDPLAGGSEQMGPRSTHDPSSPSTSAPSTPSYSSSGNHVLADWRSRLSGGQ